MFSEERLEPTYIIYGTSGGAEFSTDVVVLNSGHEARNQNWEQAKGRYDYGERKLPDNELHVIVKFFRARKGMKQGFRFKDWGDYQVAVGEGRLGETGLGTGVAAYQLYKAYVSGADVDLRIIRKPVAGTIKVFKNGIQVPASGAGSVAVAYSTGMATFIAPFPSGVDAVTWTGEFDVPVRFDSDQIKYRFDSAIVSSPGVLAQTFHYLFSLPLVEVRAD